ncbi:MAG TPA: HEPN domain-containing protein [Candidatus Deferrimicrobium sp.]|nr:HEPN domain-containing protein [Candidatus Deferrimicrobium sp.]
MNWEKDLIDYRREKAAETLENARLSLEKKHLFSSVNRIYYALFYEISALLKTRNLSSPKHGGIRSLFNQHFIKAGKESIGKRTGHRQPGAGSFKMNPLNSIQVDFNLRKQ